MQLMSQDILGIFWGYFGDIFGLFLKFFEYLLWIFCYISFKYLAVLTLANAGDALWKENLEEEFSRKGCQPAKTNQGQDLTLYCIYSSWAALQHPLVFFKQCFPKKEKYLRAHVTLRLYTYIYTLFLRLLQALIKSPKWIYYIKICVISSPLLPRMSRSFLKN